MKERWEVNEVSSATALASSPERISRPWDRQKEPRRSQRGPRAEEVELSFQRPQWLEFSGHSAQEKRAAQRERESSGEYRRVLPWVRDPVALD